MTGGSELKSRLNYSIINIVNLFLTIFFECNNKPKLDEVGDAMDGRIYDILLPNKQVSADKYEKLSDDKKAFTF